MCFPRVVFFSLVSLYNSLFNSRYLYLPLFYQSLYILNFFHSFALFFSFYLDFCFPHSFIHFLILSSTSVLVFVPSAILFPTYLLVLLLFLFLTVYLPIYLFLVFLSFPCVPPSSFTLLLYFTLLHIYPPISVSLSLTLSISLSHSLSSFSYFASFPQLPFLYNLWRFFKPPRPRSVVFSHSLLSFFLFSVPCVYTALCYGCVLFFTLSLLFYPRECIFFFTFLSLSISFFQLRVCAVVGLCGFVCMCRRERRRRRGIREGLLYQGGKHASELDP